MEPFLLVCSTIEICGQIIEQLGGYFSLRTNYVFFGCILSITIIIIVVLPGVARYKSAVPFRFGSSFLDSESPESHERNSSDTSVFVLLTLC